MDKVIVEFLQAKAPLLVLVIAAGLVLFEAVIRLPKFLDAWRDLRERSQLRKQRKLLAYLLDVVVFHYRAFRPGGGGYGDSEFYYPRRALHDEAERLGYLANKSSHYFTRTSKELPKTPREFDEVARLVNPELQLPEGLSVTKYGIAGDETRIEPRTYEVSDKQVAAEGKKSRLG
jgi:hypothetical protein